MTNGTEWMQRTFDYIGPGVGTESKQQSIARCCQSREREKEREKLIAVVVCEIAERLGMP